MGNRLIFSALFVILSIVAASCSSQVKENGDVLVYVANEGDGTISVIDAVSLKIIETIKLDGMPHNVNVDPQGLYVYATNHEEEEGAEHDEMRHVPYLRVIDASSYEVVKSVPMDEMAAHAVPSRDGKFVYVSREGGDTIAEVDISAFKISRAFKVGQGPHGFVLSNDGKLLYVPNMATNDVSIVNLETANEERFNITYSSSKCETPVAMGITNDDVYSFVTCGKSFDIYKIDNTNRKAVARLQLNKGDFPGPIQIPVHPENRYLYVPDMRNGVVHKIGIENFELVRDIATADGAHGIAYSSNGKTAYVTNTWDNSVSVLDLESDTVTGKIKVGKEPNGVAVSNGKNQGW